MKKVLFTATVDSHILHFHTPYLKYFKDNGYEVHVATNGNEVIPFCDVKHVISFERSPFKINNLKAIKQLKKVIDKEHFDIIHTHTPMGSVVTRIAAIKARKNGTRVIYTAHGFHFYKGAPIINWMLFYPIEKYLSRYTDTLITINQEDYELAKKKFTRTKVEYVPGVGIDETKFNFTMTDKEKQELRSSLNLKQDDFVLIYPAELNKNKNQIFLIKVMEKLIKDYPNIHLLLPGKDSYNGKYQSITNKKGLDKNIHFLGYRNDIPRLLKISNIAVSSSKREGLPINILEAMYVGLPIVATNCRGNRDLVVDGENGYLIEINHSEEFSNKLLSLYIDINSYNKLSGESSDKIKNYLLEKIMNFFDKIYNQKKRILHLLSSNKFSGAENVVCTIIENFRSVYDMCYCSPNGEIEESLIDRNIKYFPIKKNSIREIKEVLNEFKPDIIHAHDYRASCMASLFAKREIKIISHIHNNTPFAKSINLKSLLYYLCSTKFYKVIGVSNKILDESIFKSRISHKYFTVYNYVNKNTIIEKSNEFIFDKKYDLFFIGRLSSQKDPLFFIDIVDRIKIDNVNISAVMIGDGELRDVCLNEIKRRNLESNISLVGFKENPFPIIKNCSLGILPSKWEGFGLVAIESMILNKPILNSGVGGLGEIFSRDNYYICNSMEEYLLKYMELINNEVSLNLSQIVNDFIDVDKWKNQLLILYN